MALRTKTIHYEVPSSDVTSISSGVYCRIYDDSGASFTNEDADANNTTATDVTLLGDSNDILYIGSDVTTKKFDSCRIIISTSAAGGTRVLEYWNGAAWTTLSATFSSGTVDLLTGTTLFYWTPPSDWATVAINGVTTYWIRFRNTGAYSAAGVLQDICIGQRETFSRTVYIPETTNRTILSAQVEFSFYQNSTSSIFIQRVHGSIGVGGESEIETKVVTITNTGEHISSISRFDLTTFLETNDPGTASFTLNLVFSITSQSITTANIAQNVGCRIFITYVAEEQSTRIKTVAIPINSQTGALGTTLTTLDSIPILDSFLPEASKTYRDIWFEIGANSTSTSAVDYTLTLALDAESGDNFTFTNSANSAAWNKIIYPRNSMTTSVTHDFKAKSSAAQFTFRWMTVVLWVTYEYNHSTSTSVLNSLQLPMVEEPGWTGATGEADLSRESRELMIQEPETIAVKQSAILLNFNDSVSVGTLNIKIGSDAAFTSYTHAAGTLHCGQFGLMHRADSGLPLTRGLNTLKIDWYSNTSTRAPGMTGLLFLNYTSSIHASGDAVHNKTIWWHMASINTASSSIEISGFAPTIQENEYYLNCAGFRWSQMTDAADKGMVLLVEPSSIESPGDGWDSLFSQFSKSDAEMSYIDIWVRARDSFKRYPHDTDSSRVDIFNPKRYRAASTDATVDTITGFITTHHIKYNIAGTITGPSSVNVSGISVEAHRSDTDECIGRTTTSSSGTYSIPWYDNTIPVYVHAGSGNAGGRSRDFYAS